MKLKQNISNQTNSPESLPQFLEKLRQGNSGFKVPDRYFDSLSPRISNEIKKQENRSIFKTFFLSFRKPLVWAPVTATALVAAMLIFVIPVKKESDIQVVDEWTELNMAYDDSYAYEVLLAESNSIEQELEKTDISYIETSPFTVANEPTEEEITEYLKEQEIDTEILIEK